MGNAGGVNQTITLATPGEAVLSGLGTEAPRDPPGRGKA